MPMSVRIKAKSQACRKSVMPVNGKKNRHESCIGQLEPDRQEVQPEFPWIRAAGAMASVDQ
jgi:hypothetical protein